MTSTEQRPGLEVRYKSKLGINPNKYRSQRSELMSSGYDMVHQVYQLNHNKLVAGPFDGR